MLSKRYDLTGQVFGKLTVVSAAPNAERGAKRWNCRCSCGSTDCVYVVVRANNLRQGQTQSCGCLNKEARTGNVTHGHFRNRKRSKTLQAYHNMKRRCLDPKCDRWQYYGGRGIKICERWLASFENFLADMGVAPEGLTLERKDVSGNYGPDNCKWATLAEQAKNKRRSLA